MTIVARALTVLGIAASRFRDVVHPHCGVTATHSTVGGWIVHDQLTVRTRSSREVLVTGVVLVPRPERGTLTDHLITRGVEDDPVALLTWSLCELRVAETRLLPVEMVSFTLAGQLARLTVVHKIEAAGAFLEELSLGAGGGELHHRQQHGQSHQQSPPHGDDLQQRRDGSQ